VQAFLQLANDVAKSFEIALLDFSTSMRSMAPTAAVLL